MSAEAVIYALLSSAAPVTGWVNDRIYPSMLPTGVQPPALVYSLVSAVPPAVMDATEPTHLTRSRVQVDLLGSDFANLRIVRDVVVAALRFQRGVIATFTVHAVTLDHEGPVTFDEALALWHRPIDFVVLHQH